MSEERREQQKLHCISNTSSECKVGHGEKIGYNLNYKIRISLKARDKTVVFNNLFHNFNVENLTEVFNKLDANKASGIDKVTKGMYKENLEKNIQDLTNRLHIGTYRPQPKRLVLIPKANGQMRPIAIGCFEDKIVEGLLANVLSEVYEPLFSNRSFGFRPKKSAHDAIQYISKVLENNQKQHIVEIDFSKFFNTVSHRKLIKMLELRISDKKLLSLISRFLQVGILENNNITPTEVGTPQGSLMSPVLANLFLHHSLDSWFDEFYSTKGEMVRYADDAVFMFTHEQDSKDFLEALIIRVEKYDLQLNMDKTKHFKFGRQYHNILNFLGFTFYWGAIDNKTLRQLRVKTESKGLSKKITIVGEWLKKVRSSIKLENIIKNIIRKLRGHYNYFGFITNKAHLNKYYYNVLRLTFKWLNRRSQRKSLTWVNFKLLIIKFKIPKPPAMEKLKPLSLFRKKIYAH
jgi:group II intron reverse transcriptase/maturase